MKIHGIMAVCVMCAAILVGCAREPEQPAANSQPQSQEITISGCLTTGTGTNQYMVTAIERATESGQPTDAPATSNSPLTPDAQVRLAYAETEALRQLVGQKVTVTGHVTDDGRNTIGTSGPNQGLTPAGGKVESRDDKSAAATDQHHSQKVAQEAGPIAQRSMANGTFPEMRVTKISGSGERCPSWPTANKK